MMSRELTAVRALFEKVQIRMAVGNAVRWTLLISALSASIVCLITYQVRVRISAISIFDQTYSPWRIKRIVDEQAAINAREQASIDNIPEVRKAHDAVLEARPKFEAALRNFSDRYKSIKGSESRLPTKPRTNNTQLEELKQSLDTLAKGDAALEAAKASVLEEMKPLKEANDVVIAKRAEVRAKEAESQAARLLGVDNIKDVKRAERERSLDLIQEVTSLSDVSTWGARPFHTLLLLPHELVLFVIVVGMGITGRGLSGMKPFRTADAGGEEMVSALDPLLGGLVAVVLYIVLKAGVLVVVDTRSSGAAFTELNPFLIAFVGLVGGLLSERVIAKIRTLGSSWLADPSLMQIDRWAPRLGELMAQKGLTKEQWLVFEPSDAERFEDWVRVKQRVPAVRQEPLARWLNTPQHLLFTDVSPPTRNPDGQ